MTFGENGFEVAESVLRSDEIAELVDAVEEVVHTVTERAERQAAPPATSS